MARQSSSILRDSCPHYSPGPFGLQFFMVTMKICWGCQPVWPATGVWTRIMDIGVTDMDGAGQVWLHQNQLISVFLSSSFLGICCSFIMTPDCREHIKVEFFPLIRDQKYYHSDHRIAVSIVSSQTFSWNASHHLKSSSKVGKITFSLSRQTFS